MQRPEPLQKVQIKVMPSTQPIVIALCAVAVGVAVIWGLTRFDRGRSKSRLRLDWFLPMIRRRQPNDSPAHSALGRWLRRFAPKSWISNHATKKRGTLRRWLRKFGQSTLASPVRRVIQAICLTVFCVLFFFVCWPYDAKPRTPPNQSKALTFETIDTESGDLVFALISQENNDPDVWIPKQGETVYLMLGSDTKPSDSSVLGEFTIRNAIDDRVRLSTDQSIADSTIDELFGSVGTYRLLDRMPDAWPSHYADNLAAKEVIPAETFLVIDPLVSLSTAITTRSWVWSLTSAAAILIVCILIPRGFCGYLCPLGTTIDLFDWAIAGRVKRFRVPDDGWWVHVKYYLLAGTLIAAVCGVLVSGFFSAIPVITRAMLFIADPLQSGVMRGWHLVPAMGVGHIVSIVLFFAVLSLGFLRPRFWCKYVCPSGAVFSIGNLFRATERKVESSCIHCNKCVEICPFDAIKPDYTTRTTDCTMCQSCGGVCPTHAIKFVERWNVVELKVEDEPPTNETSLGRRGFLSLAAGSAAAVVGGATTAITTKSFGAELSDPGKFLPVRPPGSVPEQSFLEMCIRCGECFKACPNNVLQPEGFEQGLEGLWTPMVNADWAGCESSCNACGQVCPTGAIRALPIEEKKVARMGLAEVNESTCLPFAARDECDLCVQECDAAGYHAIEFTQVGVELDTDGQPIEGTGYLAPIVMPDLCVGCGLCQTRCFAINVKEEKLLDESAIIVRAGQGKEDRLMTGSYIELRQAEKDVAGRRDVGTIEGTDAREADGRPEANADSDLGDDPFGLNSGL